MKLYGTCGILNLSISIYRYTENNVNVHTMECKEVFRKRSYKWRCIYMESLVLLNSCKVVRISSRVYTHPYKWRLKT